MKPELPPSLVEFGEALADYEIAEILLPRLLILPANKYATIFLLFTNTVERITELRAEGRLREDGVVVVLGHIAGIYAKSIWKSAIESYSVAELITVTGCDT